MEVTIVCMKYFLNQIVDEVVEWLVKPCVEYANEHSTEDFKEGVMVHFIEMDVLYIWS
jgi:hypothetical protein